MILQTLFKIHRHQKHKKKKKTKNRVCYLILLLSIKGIECTSAVHYNGVIDNDLRGGWPGTEIVIRKKLIKY